MTGKSTRCQFIHLTMDFSMILIQNYKIVWSQNIKTLGKGIKHMDVQKASGEAL